MRFFVYFVYFVVHTKTLLILKWETLSEQVS
jgi:hypothetical protein